WRGRPEREREPAEDRDRAECCAPRAHGDEPGAERLGRGRREPAHRFAEDRRRGERARERPEAEERGGRRPAGREATRGRLLGERIEAEDAERGQAEAGEQREPVVAERA